MIIGAFGMLKISQALLNSSSLRYVDDGQRYFKEKDLVRAIFCFNRAVALDPKSFIAHISLADAYIGANSVDLAIEEYNEALKLTNNANESKFIKNKILEISTKQKR